MKSFRFFLISMFVFVFSFQALAKSRVLHVDPKLEKTIPVYGWDGNKATNEMTSLVPGDFLSVEDSRPIKVGGKKYVLIRAKDLSGKDIKLAIDTEDVNWGTENSAIFETPKKAREIKVTGAEAVNSTNTPGQDKDACFIGNDSSENGVCRELKPGSDIEVEDAILTLTTDGENSKPKWRNYVQGQDGFWIDSEDTSRVDESWSWRNTPKGSDCDPKNGMEELPDLTDKINELGSQQQLDEIMKHVGTCHQYRETGDYHQDIVRGVASKKDLPALVKEQKATNGSTQIVEGTRADWVAIDILARTLYGEMASCFKKGPEYPQAVAKVVLNRVDFKNQHPKVGSRFIAKEPGVRNDITNAIFKDKQFSIWNRTEQARKMAMCPPSDSQKEFWNGNLPSETELKIWKESVRIASQAVLQGQSFRKKTADLKALYYTSDFELSKKHYNPLTKATIGGKKLPLSRCVQLWSEKKLKEDFPEYGIFHPLFRKALLPIAGF